jgi:flagellar hook-length control protein FliK
VSPVQGNTAALSGGLPSGPNAATAISNLSSGKSGQTARTISDLLTVLPPMPAGISAKTSASIPPKATAQQETQANWQTPATGAPVPSENLAHSVARSAAIGATTFKFHENLPAQPAPPPPAAAIPSKPASQDLSNESAGNDANPKPDHAASSSTSNISNTQTGGINFVQTLSTPGSNPSIAHSTAADAAAISAAATAQPQGASSTAAQPAASSAAALPVQSSFTSPQGAPTVNAAHIVEQAGQTEIRIEMQADSLGGVELRAHIAGDQIGASIAVEHHDAQMALATDLPALHSALTEKNLRVETLSVSQGSFSSLSGDPGQDAGQKNFAQSPAKYAYADPAETHQAYPETPVEWAGAANSGAGLSVVA